MTNPKEPLTQIIQNFAQHDLRLHALKFFKTLGYTSERWIKEDGLRETFLENYDAQKRFNPERGLFAEWQKIYLLFQLTDDEIKPIKPEFQTVAQPVDNSIIESFLFIALELKQARYSRTDLAKITRAINQIFAMPAILLFKHGETLTLSVIHWRQSKRDDSQDVLEKVTLIKEIAIAQPHRAHLDILQQLALATLQVSNFVELYKKWQEVLDISVLNKQFYQELAVLFTQLVGGERYRNTYLTSLKLPSITDDRVLKEFAVRLIGRLLFCWFLQKKTSKAGISLIPSAILSSKSVTANFYQETLEPLFFEVLNKELEQRQPAFQQSHWRQIPFLNGGLFEPHVHDFYDFNCTLNTLIVPDDWLAKLLAFFERYHFTIEENTPLDVQVAIDPEMLGQIFENLLAEINPETGETARKATGSYYTPREIVDYMVDESLVAYFQNLSGFQNLTGLRALLSYAQTENPLNAEESQKLLKAIETIKILDPACGSGAFPMGVLQKLTLMLQRLDPNCEQWLKNLLENIPDAMARRLMQEKLQGEKELWDYTRKLGILRECIYGVDIQAIAVEISRLRCFLALIVNEKVEEDKPNRGIIPLPNLAFKFVCANTLKGISQDWQLYESQTRSMVRQLEQLRGEYLNSQGDRKAQLQTEFSQVQKSLLEVVLQWAGKDSELSQLATWKPFSDESCGWFDAFWMFGIKAGFDVVLGNPPYARVQTLQQTQAESMDFYKKNFKSAKGSFDLYVLFLEKGFSLVSSRGFLAFILPHKFFQAKFGEAIRNEITKEKAILQIVRFGAEQVFDEATTYTCLFFLSKQEKDSFRLFEVSSLKNARETLAAIQASQPDVNYQYAIINAPKSGKWNFAVGNTNKLLEKLRLQPHTLGDITRKIFVGLQTGADKIYVLKVLEWKENTVICFSNALQCQVEIEKGLVKPFLMGKDVHRYETVIAKNVVIFPYQLGKLKPVLMSQEFIKQNFPLGWDFLLKNQTALAERERGRFSSNWHSFSRPQNLTEFEAVKIMTPDICAKPEMVIDESASLYHTTTLYSFVFNEKAKGSAKYYLGLLNSKLMWYFQTVTGNVLRGGFLRFKTEYLKPFPIPESNIQEQRIIEELVDKILAAKKAGEDTSQWEREIDVRVFDLYNLTEAEILLMLQENKNVSEAERRDIQTHFRQLQRAKKC